MADETVTTEEACENCGEVHPQPTLENLDSLLKQVTRRYRLFASGFLLSALGACGLVGLYNPALGGACFLAGVTYIMHVNMVTMNDSRERLKEMQKFMSHGLPANFASNVLGEIDKKSHGQYL